MTIMTEWEFNARQLQKAARLLRALCEEQRSEKLDDLSKEAKALTEKTYEGYLESEGAKQQFITNK
ncbi:hypothetical protein KAR91_73020 [Candidatus Pacearchaeota archaeon]|nr:hypothetical protein [Candidatus Pacearchaeota archaeon]